MKHNEYRQGSLFADDSAPLELSTIHRNSKLTRKTNSRSLPNHKRRQDWIDKAYDRITAYSKEFINRYKQITDKWI